MRRTLLLVMLALLAALTVHADDPNALPATMLNAFAAGGTSAGCGGSYSVNITVVGNGSVTKFPNLSSYPCGQTVTLAAIPDGGFTFDGWSGDTTETEQGLIVSMYFNRSYTATFSASGGYSYYVDAAAANDLGAGTEADPFKTIAKVNTLVAEGDSVKLADGDYSADEAPNIAGVIYVGNTTTPASVPVTGKPGFKTVWRGVSLAGALALDETNSYATVQNIYATGFHVDGNADSANAHTNIWNSTFDCEAGGTNYYGYDWYIVDGDGENPTPGNLATATAGNWYPRPSFLNIDDNVFNVSRGAGYEGETMFISGMWTCDVQNNTFNITESVTGVSGDAANSIMRCFYMQWCNWTANNINISGSSTYAAPFWRQRDSTTNNTYTGNFWDVGSTIGFTWSMNTNGSWGNTAQDNTYINETVRAAGYLQLWQAGLQTDHEDSFTNVNIYGDNIYTYQLANPPESTTMPSGITLHAYPGGWPSP